jgi:hypothetical protein
LVVYFCRPQLNRELFIQVVRVPRHAAPLSSIHLRVHLLATCAVALHELQRSSTSADTSSIHLKEAQKLHDVLALIVVLVAKAEQNRGQDSSGCVGQYLQTLCQQPSLQQQLKGSLHAQLVRVFAGPEMATPTTAFIQSGVYRSAEERSAVETWAGALQYLSSAGARASADASMLRQIQDQLLVVDSTEAKVVFQGAKKAAKTKKEPKEDITDLEGLVTAASALRLWSGLVQLTAVPDATPAQHSRQSGETHDDQHGQGIEEKAVENDNHGNDALAQQLSAYLDAAMKVIRSIAGAVERCVTKSSESGSADSNAMLFCAADVLCAVARPLSTSLYLAGRLKDQVRFIFYQVCTQRQHFSIPVLMSVACEQISISKALNELRNALPSTVAPDLHSVCRELRTFRLTTLALTGTYSIADLDDLTHSAALNVSCAAHGALTATANGSTAGNGGHSVVEHFMTVCLALLYSEDATQQQAFLASCAAATDGSKLPSSATEFVVLAKGAYQECIAQSKRSSTGGSADRTLTWVCLLCTKVLMLVYCDVQSAHVWSGYATSAAQKCLSSRPLHAPECTLALCEAVLQRAELYEHCGNLDGCLVYLREATHIAQRLHSPAMRNIVALHTLRIWQRSASPKLHNAVDELLGGTEAERIYSSPWQLQDEHNRAARAAAATLDALFCLRSDGDHTAQVPDPQTLRFRHMQRYWDVSPAVSGAAEEQHLTCTSELGDPRTPVYHTFLPSSLRSELKAATTTPCTLSSVVLSGCTAGTVRVSVTPKGGSTEALLLRVTQTGALDAIRDTRRRMALELVAQSSTPEVTGGQATVPAQTAFLAGAASCGVAAECLGDSKEPRRGSLSAGETESSVGEEGDCDSDRAAADAALSVAALSDASECLTKALLGCPASADFLFQKLRQMLRHCDAISNCHNGASASAVCFLTVDAASNVLLVGRLGSGGVPLIAALPMQDRLQQLLTRWNELQERNQAMLRQGLDVAHITQLSDEHKRAWWAARQKYDADIESTLGDFQELLGPWRVLLSTAAATVHVSAAQVSVALAPVLQQVLHAQPPAATAGKKKSAASTISATPLVSASTAPNYDSGAEWLSLLFSNTAPCGAHPTRTMHLSQAEVTEAVTALMSSVLAVPASTLDEARLQAGVAALLTLAACQQVTSDNSTDARPPDTPLHNPAMTEAELNSLKVTELRALLKEAGLDAVGKKQDLVCRLLEHYTSSRHGSSSVAEATETIATARDLDTTASAAQATGHLVLILDEQLQRLPVECMPALRTMSCSRVPSFAVLLTLIDAALSSPSQAAAPTNTADEVEALTHGINAIVVSAASSRSSGAKCAAGKKVTTNGQDDNKENSTTSCARKLTKAGTTACTNDSATGDAWKSVSVERGWYALDIEGNLPVTRDTLQPFLSPYSQQWAWRSVVATVPPEDTTR